MTGRLLIVVGLIALSAGFPSVASARGLDDIWDIVDALSGPGPFKGAPVLSATTGCRQDGAWRFLEVAAEPDRRAPCLYVDFRDMFVEPKGPYSQVTAKFVETGVTFEQHRALEIGAGLGAAFFSTTVDKKNYNVTNFIVTPVRVIVKPLRLWIDDPRAGALQVHFRATVRFGDIDGGHFGAPNHPFRAGTEVLRGAGVVIDLWQLVKRRG